MVFEKKFMNLYLKHYVAIVTDYLPKWPILFLLNCTLSLLLNELQLIHIARDYIILQEVKKNVGIWGCKSLK